MKNLKIGAKIFFGFSCIFAFLLIIVVTSIISSVRTGSNISDVEIYSGLQSSANELMHILNETRISAGVLYEARSANASANVSKQLMYCDLRLQKLYAYMNAYPELSVFRGDIEAFDTLYTQWRTGLNAMESQYDLGNGLSEQDLVAFDALAGDMRRVNLLAHETLSNTISDMQEIANGKTNETKSFNMITLWIVVTVSVISLLAAVLLAFVIMRSITVPIGYVKDILSQIGQSGDLRIPDEMHDRLSSIAGGKDESAQCTSALLVLTDRLHSIDEVLSRVAGGDLTARIELQSNQDTMGLAVEKMLINLNQKFGAVANSTIWVNQKAGDLSDGSRLLSDGSQAQAESVGHLSDSISQIVQKIEANTQLALQAASLADDIQKNASSGTEQMSRMTEAAAEINAASQSIAKVIKVIDDIAFQTNILALNAAIEAARAGQHGEGFAVVAMEVRSLATKSAEAAKDTGTMIERTIQKAALGASIAEETSRSLEEIVKGIQQSSSIINEITQLSQAQSSNVHQITSDVKRVENIVEQNSSIAKQSAGAAGEISDQSNLLNDLVQQFQLQELSSVQSRQGIARRV